MLCAVQSDFGPPPRPDIPPPVPEKVVSIQIDYHTTDDDKDDNITVTHILKSSQQEVSRQSYGGGQTWRDWTGPWPARIEGFPFVRVNQDPQIRTFQLNQ